MFIVCNCVTNANIGLRAKLYRTNHGDGNGRSSNHNQKKKTKLLRGNYYQHTLHNERMRMATFTYRKLFTTIKYIRDGQGYGVSRIFAIF